MFSINSGFSFSHLFAARPLTKLKIGKFHHQDLRERLIHWFLVPGAMPEAHKITTIPTVASALAMWTARQWMALWKIEAGELFYRFSWTWWLVNIASFHSAMKALVPYAEFLILVTVRKFRMLLYSNCWSNVTIKVRFFWMDCGSLAVQTSDLILSPVKVLPKLYYSEWNDEQKLNSFCFDPSYWAEYFIYIAFPFFSLVLHHLNKRSVSK